MPRSTCSVQSGQRTIAVEELHREPGATPEIETTLVPGELILRIRVPATPMGRTSTYHKIRDRESYAFALASAAVALDMDGDMVASGAHRHRRSCDPALAARAAEQASGRLAG